VTAKELAERSDEELRKQLADLRAELFQLRFQHATGQLDNPMRLRQVRRDIARVLTVQRMRELARQGGPSRPRGKRRKRKA
jgi:large subunit ribosomal protein L29